MAKHRLPRTEDPQVDPFSAGEPELPWSSGDEPSADELDPVDGEGDLAAEAGPDDLGETGGGVAGAGPTRRSGAAAGRRDGGYEAPTRPDSRYDAPSTDEGRRRRPRRSSLELSLDQAAALRTQVARRRRLLWALVAIFMVVSLAAPVASCVGGLVGRVADAAGDAVESVFDGGDEPAGGWSGAFSDSDAGPCFTDAGDAEGEAVLEAFDARMEVLLADPSSGMLHELVANHLSDKLLSLLGYTADELGIDVDAWATWYLGQVSFEMDSAYADGGSGTAYAYVTAPDANEIVWDFYDEVSDYLLDNDLWGHYGSTDSMAALPSEGQREHVRSVFDEVTAAAEPGDPVLASVYVDYSGGEWVVDERDLVSSLSDVLGLY